MNAKRRPKIWFFRKLFSSQSSSFTYIPSTMLDEERHDTDHKRKKRVPRPTHCHSLRIINVQKAELSARHQPGPSNASGSAYQRKIAESAFPNDISDKENDGEQRSVWPLWSINRFRHLLLRFNTEIKTPAALSCSMVVGVIHFWWWWWWRWPEAIRHSCDISLSIRLSRLLDVSRLAHPTIEGRTKKNCNPMIEFIASQTNLMRPGRLTDESIEGIIRADVTLEARPTLKDSFAAAAATSLPLIWFVPRCCCFV